MKKLALAFTVLLIAVPLFAQLSPTATASVRYPVIGDVDGDGLDDVIDDATVQLNTGGRLAAPVPLGITGRVIDALDVNGDGAADLLVTDDVPIVPRPAGPYTLWINDGHGKFTAVRAPSATIADAVGSIVLPPLVADFDGDGKDDFITITPVAKPFSNEFNLAFLRSRGDGTFEQTDSVHLTANLPIATMPTGMHSHVTVGDINGDGIPDLIIKGQDSIVVVAGRGNGKFDAPVSHWMPYVYGYGNGMQVADIDGDGKADLVWANDGGFVTVLFGDGKGGFPRMATAQAGTPTGLASEPVSKTLALLHATSSRRDDVAVGAPHGLVVLLTFENGAFREVARTKLLDPYPADSPETPTSYREVNVFAGHFRAGSPRDLYAFDAWDGPQILPAWLLFNDATPADDMRSWHRAAGHPGTTTPATPSTMTMRVVPGAVDLATGPCTGLEDVWTFNRDGVFGSGTSSDGSQINAVFESNDRIRFGANGSKTLFAYGTMARADGAHFTGSSLWALSCGSFDVNIDAYVK